MKPLFLTTPELLEAHWESCKPLLQPVVDKAAKGEFTMQDLHDMVTSKEAFVFTIMAEKPVLAMVFEFRRYPQKENINIVAIGGANLGDVARDFLPKFQAWAKEFGVSEIEASTSPAMTRILKKIGFRHTYDFVRLPC
jgi:hypothetical protein